MTKEDIEKRLAEGNVGKPQLREIDFLRRRVSSNDSDTAVNSENEMTEGATRDLASVDVQKRPTLSLAQARLEQLRLFRQRQIEDEIIFHDGGMQARDLAQSGQLNWQPLGPAGVERGQAGTAPVVSGRVVSLAIAPDGNRIYIATGNGGVWYSPDGGKKWVSLMDVANYFPTDINAIWRADSLSCGAIALVAGAGNSNDKLYVGTGEGTFVSDAYMGVGPLVSSDGGKTWDREPSAPTLEGKGFFALVVDPNDSERVIAGTSNGIYVRQPPIATVHSWTQQAFNNQRVSSLVGAKGGGVTRYFAALWLSSGAGNVHFSGDGNNWTPLPNGYPTTRVGRTSLAVHPHNPNIVYAMIATTGASVGTPSVSNPVSDHLLGIYRLDMSTDQKWYKINGKTAADTALLQKVFGTDPATKAGQGDYDNCIRIAPNNVNRIYIGGSGLRNANADWIAGIYRCEIEMTGSGATTQLKARVTVIGNAVHADIHDLVFVPNEPQKLWVACDGGVFFTNRATGTGDIFESRNHGLQTMTQEHIALNPLEEENFFACAQDNGCLRYLGDDVWLHTAAGDGGYCVINWNEPNKVINTYALNSGYSSVHGGNRPATPTDYDVSAWSIPIYVDAVAAQSERLLFYAPLVGVPYKAGLAGAKANILAFGTQRPWISLDFGANWKAIPSQSHSATDLANFTADKNLIDSASTDIIQTLTFASPTVLLVGTLRGKVYMYEDKSPTNNWTNTAPNPIVITRLDNVPAAANPFLSLSKSITCIAVHPTDATKCYVTLGGSNAGTQRVWLYDPAATPKWADKSTGLIDVHFNTIAINPKDPNQLFAGSDVGIWKSDNGGTSWNTFSFGLPETPIVDLQVFYRPATDPQGELLLLRASTHGRGVFECNLTETVTPDIKLFMRGHILDGGRNKISLTKKDPRNPSVTIDQIDTPDIKIDVPNNSGLYAFRYKENPSPAQFQLAFVDKAQQIPVPATGEAISRVYVQIHSRGIVSANNIHVFLLLKEITGANLPDLPPNYKTKLQNAIPIEDDGWKTIGIRSVHDVAAGSPKIVQFDLSSSVLPTHAAVGGGGKNFVLVALAHHPSDPFISDDIKIDPSVSANNLILSDERKAMFKRIKVVQHAAFPAVAAPLSMTPLAGFVRIPDSATLPEAPYDAFLGMSFRLNDVLLDKTLLSRLAQPISNRGTDTPAGNPDADFFYLANSIETSADLSLREGVPLIWLAREKIIINHNIDGKNKGASSGDGNFGGSGGGSATNAGKACKMPRKPAVIIAAGGTTTATKVGADLSVQWASRALLMLPFATGGASGGDDGANKGGLGGGVVILCAPKIEITGTGKIDVSGGLGAGNAGGGGGGLIILIAGEIINPITEGATANLIFDGGNSAGTGGKGGKGVLSS